MKVLRTDLTPHLKDFLNSSHAPFENICVDSYLHRSICTYNLYVCILQLYIQVKFGFSLLHNFPVSSIQFSLGKLLNNPRA